MVQNTPLFVCAPYARCQTQNCFVYCNVIPRNNTASARARSAHVRGEKVAFVELRRRAAAPASTCSHTFSVDSGTFLFLFQQTRCSGAVKLDAREVTPRPRTYKANVPSPLGEAPTRGRDVGKRARQSEKQPDGSDRRPLLGPRRPTFSTLAASTAPPHMPDITVCNPRPTSHPLLSEDMSTPGQGPRSAGRRGQKQDGAGSTKPEHGGGRAWGKKRTRRSKTLIYLHTCLNNMQ